MICVYVPVQNYRALNGLNGLGDLLDRFRLAAFAEVWYTLDKTAR